MVLFQLEHQEFDISLSNFRNVSSKRFYKYREIGSEMLAYQEFVKNNITTRKCFKANDIQNSLGIVVFR